MWANFHIFKPRVMLCLRGVARYLITTSVCPSVNAGIVSKRMHTVVAFFDILVRASSYSFLRFTVVIEF